MPMNEILGDPGFEFLVVLEGRGSTCTMSEV